MKIKKINWVDQTFEIEGEQGEELTGSFILTDGNKALVKLDQDPKEPLKSNPLYNTIEAPFK